MILLTGTGALADAFAQQYSCKVISARFLDDESLIKEIALADVIIHNAAVISCTSLFEYIESNFNLTKRILELVKRTNPDIKFINISTMSFLRDENNYLEPEMMSDYAFSKYISELYCLRFPKNISNVRFSTLFYLNPKRDGLSKLANDGVINQEISIFNNGEAMRDFIPLDIAVQYLYKLSKLNVLPKKINIASGNALSFRHFANRLISFDPKIKIKNIFSETTTVLSRFSSYGIKQLGEIEFDIDEIFDNYLIKLNENPNL